MRTPECRPCSQWFHSLTAIFDLLTRKYPNRKEITMANGDNYRLPAPKSAFSLESNLQAQFFQSASAPQPVASAARYATVQSLLIQFSKYGPDGPMIKSCNRLTWN